MLGYDWLHQVNKMEWFKKSGEQTNWFQTHGNHKTVSKIVFSLQTKKEQKHCVHLTNFFWIVYFSKLYKK